ncbi:LiaI-LiaF-like domain-containing protein [Silvibacterium acidisoli]|uniref:LiaI-LiaF-like domain-containing protein n=1 Tax=Acidobacteriaceae bacterium ZG23-2 TaxID=2883246 RepID=UPI00406CAD84
MNSYVFLHRIKGPAMLLVFGITALLNEWDILSYGRSWPLYLIVFGVLQLAERAALMQWQQSQAAQQAYAGWPAAPPPPSSTSLSITPQPPHSGEEK